MTAPDLRAIDLTSIKEVPCPALQHELRVILAEDAFDRAVERGTADTSREIGGVLVGQLLRDKSGPYLSISATIDALHAEEKGAELTFTHATWEHIHGEMDGKHKGKQVVGWYHTHPGFGVFLSDRDQFIHKSFFDLPFQVAFVYDPKSREHGMFAWKSGEAARMRRFWIGNREQTWDGDRGDPQKRVSAIKAAVDEAAANAAAAPMSAGDSGAPLSFVAAVAVLCLLIGGFAGNWVGTGRAEQSLLVAQTQIVQARAEGANAAIATLQQDLLLTLRDAIDAEALLRPLDSAVRVIDQVIAGLGETRRATAANATGAAGNAAPPATFLARLGFTFKPVPANQAGATPLEVQVARLGDLRRTLARLATDRFAAQDTLRALARASGRLQAAGRDEVRRADLEREMSAQRAGLGALYAELGAEAGKAGDRDKARRMFATAAQLDPGNRARYETQLQAFDKSARLAPPAGRSTGARP